MAVFSSAHSDSDIARSLASSLVSEFSKRIFKAFSQHPTTSTFSRGSYTPLSADVLP